MHYFLRTMYVLFRLNNHLCRAMDCLHCKPMFHHSIHHLATLKLNSVTAKRSVVGMLHYFIQPCMSVHLVKVACVLACHPSEQISLTMKIPLSPGNSPASLTGSPSGSPLEVFWANFHGVAWDLQGVGHMRDRKGDQRRVNGSRLKFIANGSSA